MPQYEVEGGRELRRTLKGVEDGLADLKQVHADVAGIVAGAARPRTPTVTGTLASTIRPSGTARQAVVRAGFARVPYAGVIEWGWPLRNIGPQPYLVPAAHDTESTWRKRYDDRVNELLRKVKGA